MYVYFKRKTRLREDSGMSEYKHYKTHKTSLVCEHVCVCMCVHVFSCGFLRIAACGIFFSLK